MGPYSKAPADPNELKSVCSVPKLRCVRMMILIGGSLWSARVGLVLFVAWQGKTSNWSEVGQVRRIAPVQLLLRRK